MSTVADATYETWARLGLTTMFANPGSTEIPLLSRSAEQMRFVLGLHENAVVGTAVGHALATDSPALVVLHTTAGYGNAVGALATARVNRAPLVVVVGQQDRRHLPLRPFLAGELQGLAGDYPVWSTLPGLARDVPEAMARAYLEARARRGPAVVVVPMDDWTAAADPEAVSTARAVRSAVRADPAAMEELSQRLDAASSPALVVGADADGAESWAALVELAEHLGCPVWQEAFGARAGFPQDHPRYVGQLPAGRGRLRDVLAPHDFVLVVGAPAFRQYPYEPGPLVGPATRLAMVVDDPELAHHSPVDLAVVAPLAGACRALVAATRRRASTPLPAPRAAATEDAYPGEGRLRPRHVFWALRQRLLPDTVVVEESPSSRPELERLLPARRPLGFLSAAMGGLGFALPAAVGLRLGRPNRPVVAVVGDGSSLYGIQALWTAAHYGVGVLFVVLRNGRYAVMDRLAEQQGAPGPWPSFEEVGVATLAEGFGCRAQRVHDHGELVGVLDKVVPTLARATEPLLLEVDVADEGMFAP